MSAQVETHEFQAEAQQLLQLMVHSIYSNKDVFLRELVSNAADALDKLRLEAFVDKDLQVDTSDLHVRIEVDREQRTLTVRDNGIGMSRAEVVELIGTIAKSGTAELLAKARESQESGSAELIGQFGVGFYSSFMVADQVSLVTRRAGEDEATRWESDGSGTYTVETLPEAPQGTAVTLRLRPEEADDGLFDYSSEHKIRELVQRYSDFITWPVRMEVERSGDDGGTERAIETLNSMKALWATSPAASRIGHPHHDHRWAPCYGNQVLGCAVCADQPGGGVPVSVHGIHFLGLCSRWWGRVRARNPHVFHRPRRVVLRQLLRRSARQNSSRPHYPCGRRDLSRR
ncbi:ATP-binding protein [Saccharopolyspora endophytica]|uniref:ATP-binding protein n=1 Tax=Saccharopolyspora endophytica TaxID=543886 RepID=A0ABS5DAX1_9PSEU|nr:ATP-binding protein [Saccharopolyspora endophytica]